MGIFLVALISSVLHHLIMSHRRRGARDLHPSQADSGSNVVILATPTPVFIGEAIHLQVLVRSECRYPSKVLGIREAVSKLVHGNSNMPGSPGVTHIQIVVVLWQEVHIMQEQAVPLFIAQGLPHPDIQQLCPIKCSISSLVDDIDAISKLLPLQKGVQVVEQEAQVVLPSTVGHNDGCSGAGLTPCRAVPAAWFHSGIPLHNLHQRWHRAEGHRHGTH